MRTGPFSLLMSSSVRRLAVSFWTCWHTRVFLLCRGESTNDLSATARMTGPMSTDRTQEVWLEALKPALSAQGEQRLFKSGKLPGLFPSRTSLNADVAAHALREGLLEVVRAETKGKSTTEWVKITPKGIDLV